MADNPRDQLGVDLPDPSEPQAVPPELTPEPEPERPDYLLDKFKTAEDQARGYAEAERRMNEAVEGQRRLEQQVAALTEAVEGFRVHPDDGRTQQGDDQIRARLNQSFDEDPIGTIAYLAQQYASSAIDERFAAMQQQQNPAMQMQQERDNQLLAMMVDQRLGETIDDWDEYRDRVGQEIVNDQTLIPQEVLYNPEATVNAIRRVYQMVKANDIIEQNQNGTFVTTQMKRQAQTMSGSGVRNPDADPTDEKMDALRNAVVGSSYSAWRGGA